MDMSQVHGLLGIFVVLACGAMAISIAATLLAARIRWTTWQRAIWQTAVIAILGLVAVEFSGTAGGICEVAKTVLSDRAVEPAQQPAASQEGISVLDARADRSAVNWPTLGGEWFVGQWDVDLEEKNTSFESPMDSRTNIAEGKGVGSLLCEAPFGPFRKKTPDPFSSVTFESAVTRDVVAEAANAVGTIALDAIAASPGTENPGNRNPGNLFAVRFPFANVAAILWFLGAAVVLGRLLWSRFVLFWFTLRHVTEANHALSFRAGQLAQRLGMPRRVRVLSSKRASSPAAFGCLRPTIVLPDGFDQTYATCEQEVMLAHEVAHLAAGDPLWHLLADVLCGVLWWHPSVWWSRNQLRMTSEAAADEASLIVPEGPDVLAGCLVNLGRRLTRPRLGWLAMEGNGFRSGLARRVERLLDMPARAWKSPRRIPLVCARTVLPVVFLILAVSCTAWARPQALPPGDPDMNVMENSWRHSLAAVVLATLIGPMSGDMNADTTPDVQPADEQESDALEVALLEDNEEDEDTDRRPGEDFDDEEGDDAEDADDEGDEEAEAREREEELREAGRHLRELFRERREIQREHRRVERELDRARKEDDAEAVEELERELGELSDRFGDIKEEMEEIKNEFGERFREQLQGHRPPGPQNDLGRRIHHLHRAADNLEAAGMREEANHIRRKAERLAREARERHGRDEREGRAERPPRGGDFRREGPPREGRFDPERLDRPRRDGEGRDRPPRDGERSDRPRPDFRRRDRPDGSRSEDSDRGVQELRGEMEDLRRELRELQHTLRRVINHIKEKKGEE